MYKRITEILKGSFVNRTSGYLDVTAKEDLFMEISSILGGVFSKSHNPGNVLSTLRIAIPYKKWEIILTESDTRPLRFEVDFESLTDYALIIGVEDAIDKILKKLGKSEIEFGDEIFDDQYLVHSSDPVLAGKILNDRVRAKIIQHRLYNISYLTDHKRKKSQLFSVVSRTIDDKDAYLDMVTLHQMLIDSLSDLKIIDGR